MRSGRALIWGGAAVLAVAALAMALAHPPYYDSWYDQAQYLQSARAWAAWDLDPRRHLYLPGYPLLAAPFVRLLPSRPFLVPDLLCLLAAYGLFVRVCDRIAGAPLMGALAFLGATLSSRTALALWVVPWTTTPAAPLTLLALLAALRQTDGPEQGVHRTRHAFVAGLAGGAVAAFRPLDAAIVLAAAGPFTAWALRREGAGTFARTAAAGAGGVGLAWLPPLAAHVAVHGWEIGTYLSGSAGMGFEWRLLPLRWVCLVVDPRPLLPDGHGLAEGFPWIAPGLTGLVLMAALGPGVRRAPWLLLGGAVAAHWTAYLAYRDLHADGLWRFDNCHYFKWTLPVLAFGALQFARALLAGPRIPALAAGLLVGAGLFAWRPELRVVARGRGGVGPAGFELPGGLASLDDAVLVQMHGSWDAIYFGLHLLRAGDRLYGNTRDVKLLPLPNGAMLVPLRRLPPGPATLIPAEGVAILPAAAWIRARQQIVFGLPCAVAVCPAPVALPPGE